MGLGFGFGFGFGLAEGLGEGLAEGLEVGRVVGRVDGFADGFADGLAEGLADGLAEGFADDSADDCPDDSNDGVGVAVTSGWADGEKAGVGSSDRLGGGLVSALGVAATVTAGCTVGATGSGPSPPDIAIAAAPPNPRMSTPATLAAMIPSRRPREAAAPEGAVAAGGRSGGDPSSAEARGIGAIRGDITASAGGVGAAGRRRTDRTVRPRRSRRPRFRHRGR